MFKLCCCCVDLRKGCIIIAILGIIVNCGYFGTDLPSSSKEYKLLISGNVIGLIGNLSLLFGAFKSNKIAISLYLVLELIQMVLYFAFSIMMFVLYNKVNKTTGSIGISIGTLILVEGIFGLLTVLVWIYLWLCVFSLFLKLKREEP